MHFEGNDQLPWLHGSPEALSTLRVSCTITQYEQLARVFSHKPTLVSTNDDGTIQHNGRREGILYRIAEPVCEDDVVPVPRSTIGTGQEWHITRPLRVVAIAQVPVDPRELLSEWEEEELRRRSVQSGT